MKINNWKTILAAAAMTTLVLTGCAVPGAPQAAAPAEITAPAEETAAAETAAEEATLEEAAPAEETAEAAEAPVEETAESTETAETVLPPYTYPVDDPLYAAISNYVTEELSKHFEPADVSIPCIRYVSGINTDNPDDIPVLADFQIYNYDLEGDTLMTQSGGSFPGKLHLKKTGDDTYEVVSFDQVLDGEGFTESAKKIAGDDYDAFMNIISDQEAREQGRAATIADYVAVNHLPITKYQDYGWDPVELPAPSPEVAGPEAAADDEAEIPFPETEDYVVTTDIDGCDTFTQIVDKLESGKGYANATLDGTDVLLVASGTFDGDGFPAAIDAEVFYYNDGVPAFLGYVTSGGTAYPLAVKDGKLYTAGNHFVCKNTVTDGRLVVMEAAGETFDTDGNATYHYTSDDGGDYSDLDQEEAKSILESLYGELEDAEIIEFNTVK